MSCWLFCVVGWFNFFFNHYQCFICLNACLNCPDLCPEGPRLKTQDSASQKKVCPLITFLQRKHEIRSQYNWKLLSWQQLKRLISKWQFCDRKRICSCQRNTTFGFWSVELQDKKRGLKMSVGRTFHTSHSGSASSSHGELSPVRSAVLQNCIGWPQMHGAVWGYCFEAHARREQTLPLLPCRPKQQTTSPFHFSPAGTRFTWRTRVRWVQEESPPRGK